jgi:hypothetical protein
MQVTERKSWLKSRRNRNPYHRQLTLRFRPRLELFEQRLAPTSTPLALL